MERLVSIGSGRIGLAVVAPIAVECGLHLTLTSDTSYDLLKDGCYSIVEYEGKMPKRITPVQGYEVLRRQSERDVIKKRLAERNTRVVAISMNAGTSESLIKEIAVLLKEVMDVRSSRRFSPKLFVLIVENGAGEVANALDGFLRPLGNAGHLGIHPCVVDRMVPGGLARIKAEEVDEVRLALSVSDLTTPPGFVADSPVITTEPHYELAIAAGEEEWEELGKLLGASSHVRRFSRGQIEHEERLKLWGFNGLHAIGALFCYLVRDRMTVSVREAISQPKTLQFIHTYAGILGGLLEENGSNSNILQILRRNIERIRKFRIVEQSPEFVLRNLHKKLRLEERFLGPIGRIIQQIEEHDVPVDHDHARWLVPAMILGYLATLIAAHTAEPFAQTRVHLGLSQKDLAVSEDICESIFKSPVCSRMASHSALGLGPFIDWVVTDRKTS